MGGKILRENSNLLPITSHVAFLKIAVAECHLTCVTGKRVRSPNIDLDVVVGRRTVGRDCRHCCGPS